MKSTIATLLVLTLGGTTMMFSQAGQSGLSFLKLGIGARSLAMGEAAVASSNDPSATYYNPAGLHFARNPQLLVMHKEWIQGTQTEFLAASVPTGSLTVGASLNATSVPDIEIRQRAGPAEGTFTARNAAIGVSAAYSIDTLISLGASIKYLYEKILVDETSGIGFDMGGLYNSPLDVAFGVSITNLGSMGRLRNETSKLPTILRVGAARSESFESLDAILTLAADVVSILPEKNTHVLFGSEFNYKETFALRLGYMSGYETRNITAGIGIRYEMLNLDYAFVPFKLDLGTTHTFSLVVEF